MRVLRSAALAAFLTVSAACTDDSGPADIYVITFDSDAADFRLRVKRVSTLDSIGEGRGSTTRILKEPQVRITDDGDLHLEGGWPPNILTTQDADGAHIPEDWDSLTLLSYYHHLEKSVDWFRDVLGHAEVDEVVPLPSYYRLEVGFDQNVIGLTDNAAYAPTAHSFLLFDEFFLDDLPLAMNDGVVVHELAHAVFHRVMNGDQRLPIEYREGWGDAPIAHLGAVHEAQADIFAGMMLDEPDFFRFSLPSELADRDMSKERILTDAQAFNLGIGEARVHEIGAVIAAAVWAFSETHGRERTAELTLAAEQALLPDLNGAFHLGDFLGRFADAGSIDEKATACGLFCVRFDSVKDRFPTCGCP